MRDRYLYTVCATVWTLLSASCPTVAQEVCAREFSVAGEGKSVGVNSVSRNFALADNGLFEIDGHELRKIPSSRHTGWIDRVHFEGDESALVFANSGLFWLREGRLSKVPDDGKRTVAGIFDVVSAPDGRQLAVGSWGIHQFKDGSLSYIPPTPDVTLGQIWEHLVARNGEFLIRSDKGLYRVDAAEVSRLFEVEVSHGMLKSVWERSSGQWLAVTKFALLTFDGETLAPVVGQHEEGFDEAYSLEFIDDGRVYLRTSQGVYLFRNEELVPVLDHESEHIGSTTALVERDGEVLAETFLGLFALTNDRAQIIQPTNGEQTGRVYDLFPEPKGGLIVSAENGLFSLNQGELSPILVAGTNNSVLPIQVSNGSSNSRLVVATDRVYLLSNGVLTPISLVGGNSVQSIYSFQQFSDQVWIVGGEDGPFQLQNGELRSISGAQYERGELASTIGEWQSGERFIGTSTGLFRLFSC